MDNDNHPSLGIESKPQCDVNTPALSNPDFVTFKDLVNSAPPEKRERLTRHVANLLVEGFEQFTTNNGDGAFTHELLTPNKDWPNVIK